jgi:hypothetical protein
VKNPKTEIAILGAGCGAIENHLPILKLRKWKSSVSAVPEGAHCRKVQARFETPSGRKTIKNCWSFQDPIVPPNSYPKRSRSNPRRKRRDNRIVAAKPS